MSRRADFDLPADEIYLDGGYCSPLPKSARPAVEEAWALNAQPWRIQSEHFFDYPDAVRERVARVLGLPAEEFGVVNGTAFGVMQIAQGVRWRPGERILLGPDEFPSNVYPWFAARERGASVEYVGERGSPLRIEQLERALNVGAPVRVLAVGAVHYLTGNLHPLEEFARRLHARGALLVVDATQAAGSVDLDWSATGADAVVTSGYKWLFGPYGTGAVWMRHELLGELINANGNWWANSQARDFTKLLEYSEMPLHGRRLDMAETASFLNLAAWRAGLDYLLEVGVAAVEAHHRALQDRLAIALEDGPIEVLSDLSAAHRSPMLYLATSPQLDGQRLQAELAVRRIRVSLRGGRVRVTPGIWSGEDDVDAFAQAVRTVAA